MLGSVGETGIWRFAAVGKHPVAKDYFRIGDTNSMVNGFAEWVGNGYGALERTEKPSAGTLLSYRFFARGPGKELLACGVLRDSADAMGRPYPLLVMGCGPLGGWEERWDLLPLACEKTWAQMEYASTGSPVGFSRFETQVREMRPPDGNWSGVSTLRNTVGNPDSEAAERVSGCLREGRTLVALAVGGGGDPALSASIGFSLARSQGQTVPNAVFLGGTFDRTRLALYTRPLTAADFAALWRSA